jgi:hypothetical protein
MTIQGNPFRFPIGSSRDLIPFFSIPYLNLELDGEGATLYLMPPGITNPFLGSVLIKS